MIPRKFLGPAARSMGAGTPIGFRDVPAPKLDPELVRRLSEGFVEHLDTRVRTMDAVTREAITMVADGMVTGFGVWDSGEGAWR